MAHVRPPATGIAMVVLIPALYFATHGAVSSGWMDTEHTYDDHADGPMADLYDALLTARDGGSCTGACGAVVADLDADARAQAGSCLTEGDSLLVRKLTGDSRERLAVLMRCGDGALWRAELRNDVPEDALLAGGEVPSNWSITSLEPDIRD